MGSLFRRLCGQVFTLHRATIKFVLMLATKNSCCVNRTKSDERDGLLEIGAEGTTISLIYHFLRSNFLISCADAEQQHTEDPNGLGGKNIGSFGSFVYVINQIFGPGLVALPIVFQQCNFILKMIPSFFYRSIHVINN
jgi:hypothetical protein